MPMFEDCVHHQTRTYPGGETARYCTLDLAPEAPWRCPADCPRHERLALGMDYDRGSLVRTDVPPAPDAAPEDIAAVLDEAEDIVNAVTSRVLAELDGPPKRRWWHFGRAR